FFFQYRNRQDTCIKSEKSSKAIASEATTKKTFSEAPKKTVGLVLHSSINSGRLMSFDPVCPYTRFFIQHKNKKD
ncbi:MAG: hypothetical protein O4753_05045, partial [Trichodesmium sp. St7_bin2_1]|nr:hypothetical protein [Trichodesmium sp. St7_bin2_1]